jgi:hypothetical protein
MAKTIPDYLTWLEGRKEIEPVWAREARTTRIQAKALTEVSARNDFFLFKVK